MTNLYSIQCAKNFSISRSFKLKFSHFWNFPLNSVSCYSCFENCFPPLFHEYLWLDRLKISASISSIRNKDQNLCFLCFCAFSCFWSITSAKSRRYLGAIFHLLCQLFTRACVYTPKGREKLLRACLCEKRIQFTLNPRVVDTAPFLLVPQWISKRP